MANQKTEHDFIDLTLLDENLQLQEEGLEVHIVGPDNKPLGLIITVYGPDSAAAERALKEMQKEEEAEAAKDGSLEEDTATGQRRRSIVYLSKLTKGWNKPPRVDGEELKFSEENAKRLYTKYPIIKGQVEFKAERRSSFIKS